MRGFLRALLPLLCLGQQALAATPVGTAQAKLGSLVYQVWYPAAETATLSTPEVFDIRQWLPPAEASKVPDAAKPYQTCDCYRDLSLAPSASPRPLVLMVHGTASFRTASLKQATAYAAQGAIVIAADHAGLMLKDVISNPLGLIMNKAKQDVTNLLKAIRAQDPALHPVLRSVDTQRIILIGHSAGAGVISSFANEPGVRLLVSMAGASGSAGNSSLNLFLAGDADKIASYDRQRSAYQGLSGAKAFVGLARAGHLAFTDICGLMPEEGGILNAAQKYGLKVPSIISRLGQDGCGADQLSGDEALPIITEAVRRSLARALDNKVDSSALEALASEYADVREVIAN